MTQTGESRRIGVVEKAFDKHLDDCLKQHEAVQGSITALTHSVKEVTDLISGAKTLIWRAVIGLAGVIATTAATILVQSFNTSHEVAAKADAAAQTAAYTRTEAARDRQELLQEIRQLKDGK